MSTRVLAAILCAFLLTGCAHVKSYFNDPVTDEPAAATPAPAPKAVAATNAPAPAAVRPGERWYPPKGPEPSKVVIIPMDGVPVEQPKPVSPPKNEF